MPTYAMLINGELTGSSRSLDVINPATEEVAATCPRATHEHLNRAVEAAACAFPKWRAVPWHHRAETLLALADAIESKRDDIPPVITLEQGKPLAESRMEVERALSFARALATFTQEPEILQDDAVRRVELHRKPLGVVGAIVPWNVPFMQSVYKIVPAILTRSKVCVPRSSRVPTLCSWRARR